jgi:hypothetical protein
VDENGIMYATGHSRSPPPPSKKRRYLLFKIGKRCLEYCSIKLKSCVKKVVPVCILHHGDACTSRWFAALLPCTLHEKVTVQYSSFFSNAPEIYRLMITACKNSECILFFSVRNAAGGRTIFRMPCISMYILSCLWCEWCLVKHVVQYGYHCLFTLPCVALVYRLLFMALAFSLCIPSFQCMLVLCCSI